MNSLVRLFINRVRVLSFLSLLLFTILLIAGCSTSAKKASEQSTRIDLGKAKAKDPDPKRLIKTEAWDEVPANQLAVMLKNGQTRKDADKLAKELGGTVVGEIEYINLYQIETTGTTEADLTTSLKKAQKAKGVESAFPNSRLYPSVKIMGTAHDQFKEDVYSEGENGRHYEMTGVKNAWDIINASGVKMSNVTAGVADRAFYAASDDLTVGDKKAKPKPGKAKISALDPQDITKDPSRDSNGSIKHGGFNHGTMVSQTIGADAGNGGMMGVAGILGDKLTINQRNIYDQAKEFTETNVDPNDPTQAIHTNGKAYTIKTLVHLKKLVESGATVINCSFGPSRLKPGNAWESRAYKKFLEKLAAEHPNVVFVAASGNSNQGTDGSNDIWGHKLPNLITVGALDNKGNRSSYSNYATGNGEVSLSAPADDMVLAIGPDGKPVKASGTSFAAPQVVAAVALIQSINPDLTAAEIKQILVETAARRVVNPDKSVVDVPANMGAGVMRLDDAVLKVINDLRVKQGLKPLSKETLLGMGAIELYADGGPTDYRVEANLKTVGDKGAQVRIELQGEGAISGDRTKTLSKSGAVSWKVTLIKGKSATAKVTRLDTGAWAYVDLTTNPGIPGDFVLIPEPNAQPDYLLKNVKIEVKGNAVDISYNKVLTGFEKGNAWITFKGTYDPATAILDLQFEGGQDTNSKGGPTTRNLKNTYSGTGRQKITPSDGKVSITYSVTHTTNLTYHGLDGTTAGDSWTDSANVTVNYSLELR